MKHNYSDVLKCVIKTRVHKKSLVLNLPLNFTAAANNTLKTKLFYKPFYDNKKRWYSVYKYTNLSNKQKKATKMEAFITFLYKKHIQSDINYFIFQ